MNFSRNFYLSSIVLSIFIIGFCIANPRLEEPGDIDHLKKFLNLKKTLISCCGCCAGKIKLLLIIIHIYTHSNILDELYTIFSNYYD